MKCSSCGRDVDVAAQFCDGCGDRLVKPQNLRADENGVYRWMFEFSLWKNPLILQILLKMFFWISLGVALLLFAVTIGDGFTAALKAGAQVFLITCAVTEGLSLLGYAAYALFMGGKYLVLFEMDDKGVTHRQMNRQFKKAQGLALLTALMGAGTGNLSMQGLGINNYVKSGMHSDFAKVKSLQIIRRRNTVKLNSALNYNQVYAEDGDFDFVVSYLRAHCKNASVKE